MKAVFLTAGAAGMYCGSCMHDNALAKAMRDHGVDCVLQPLYTPIRTDAKSMAGEQIFFGGIHVYLLQQMPWLRFLPRALRGLLDWPPLIRLATRRAHATDASKLGELTISMLSGKDGNQAAEVHRLTDWLANEMQPEVVLFSNLLIGGALPSIRNRLPNAKMFVLLQGDDIFFDHLSERHREEVIQLCRELVNEVDFFLVHTQFYGDKMSELLQIPSEKLIITPLSIDLDPFRVPPASSSENENREDSFRLGYLARIAPEKGFHQLVDAFIQLAPQAPEMTLHAAGWLGEANRTYFEEQQQKLVVAGLEDRFQYHGSPDLAGKTQYLRSLDLLCVPTEYEEPKGLFVLEAMAAGVPVVQPGHGSFPELIQRTQGGVVVPPNQVEELVKAIHDLRSDLAKRQRLAAQGHANVHANHSIEQAAKQMKEILFGD